MGPRVRGITIGRAVSEQALIGYETEEASAAIDVDAGFPVLPAVPGHVITDQMVEQALAEDG